MPNNILASDGTAEKKPKEIPFFMVLLFIRRDMK
jgi:hypothetical protein